MQYSPYPIYLSHKPDRSAPIYTPSSARLYQSVLDEKTPSEKQYSSYPIYLADDIGR